MTRVNCEDGSVVRRVQRLQLITYPSRKYLVVSKFKLVHCVGYRAEILIIDPEACSH